MVIATVIYGSDNPGCGLNQRASDHMERGFALWHLDPNSLEARSMNSSFSLSMVHNKKHRWLGSGPRGQANWGWCQGFPAISMGRKRQSKFQLSPLGLKEWRHFPHIATWWLVTCFIPLSHANNLMYSCSHADLSHTYLISVQVYIYTHIIYTVYIYIYKLCSSESIYIWKQWKWKDVAI